MAENASVMYDYSRKWGAEGSSDPETATSSFIITGGKGGHKTQYAVHGSGAEHKVEYRATKISGDVSFASEITLTANEAGGENFDSVIEFDTLNGNATIRGRVYNSKEGRPATIEELDAVGRYLLNHHLNVSSIPITPDSWLDFCSLLNHDVPEMPDGIYIAPLGYDLVKGKLVRQQNSSSNLGPT
jgi:hypothetical protein